MSEREPPARRLIAGAIGPERRPYRKDPDEPRWFEPMHVRAPVVARETMAQAVAAGADVLVAPTWLTHRRALLPVGETRRAAAWTAAAVQVAREAVDRGLELRQRAAEAAAEEEAADDDERSASRPAHPPGVECIPVLVAGVVPFLGGVEEADAGKLAPRDAGVERDLRAATGLLAEAEADLLLVDGGPAVAGARAAADAAVETGLPVWMTVPVQGSRVPALPGGETVEAWATSMIHAGVAGFLLVPGPGCDVAGALERVRAAGVAPERTGVLPEPFDEPVLAESAARWLEAGAWHVGLLDGSTPGRLAALRRAIDAVDWARLAARAAERDRWVALVGEAARRAPGGRAAWIGPHDPAVPLPAGFSWTIVPASAAAALPAGELRLVITALPLPVDRLGALLEPGGILLVRDIDPVAVSAAGLRLLDVVAHPPTVFARRDP